MTLKFKQLTAIVLLTLITLIVQAIDAPKQFSTAGFYALEGSGRTVEDMNPAWRFTKDPEGKLLDQAWKTDFNDSKWQAVSLPNGMELLPVDASGGVNYRGISWYRKTFALGSGHQGKRLVLHFEAIMGKSKVWINGTKVADHFSGFIPLGIDITPYVKCDGSPNLITVMADNADDPDFPPGKPQATLDFCYFGGIYRDCWLISSNNIYITDPNMVDKVADGGLFVSYSDVSERNAIINTKLNLKNDTEKSSAGRIEYQLQTRSGKQIAIKSIKYSLAKGADGTFETALGVANPSLWSPDEPNLYNLNIRIYDNSGKILDGYTRRIGIRSIRFTPKEGFVLNGRPYPRKLIGANRHQDYAVIGNALPNNIHWRDAYKLKQAGMDIVRNAHYPQDPAFMDACEELGLFMIVNTPGWQFWNEKPIFEQRVYSDIRNMVRRDRNSPIVLMWEPILNETWYPDYFAKNVHNIVKEEYPYTDNYTSCDDEARGKEHFDILFTHPHIPGAEDVILKHIDSTKVYFTREWGDNVDDWNSHNSPSRVAIGWGEQPQLIQATHYANPPYPYTSYDALYRTQPSHIGGTLWHSFDHQRGYHPDPFYGGVMDAFRRPKYSYYMFRSQSRQVEPMVFIANDMNPFSSNDVTVFSNCDEVRLHTFYGDTLRVYKRPEWKQGLPFPAIVFEKAYNFMADKANTRAGKHAKSYLLAEGLIDGKVVATHKCYPARRPTKLILSLDSEGAAMVANGGDMMTVVASMVDANGNIKRLNNQWVTFEVQGEARIVGADGVHANPRPVTWGEAPILIQSTLRPGKVKIRASVQFEGDNTPVSAEIEFATVAPGIPMIYSPEAAADLEDKSFNNSTPSMGVDAEKRAEIEAKLREVEAQQEAFGEKGK